MPIIAKFEPEYQRKVLHINLLEGSTAYTTDDVRQFKADWLKALKSWHSPYKAIIDCRHLQCCPQEDQAEPVKEAFTKLIKLLEKLFLRKAVGFGYAEENGHHQLPFEVHLTKEDALKAIGFREKKDRVVSDFRSSLQFESHFRQRFIELSFLADVNLQEAKTLRVLQNALMNQLMQWHASWILLVDCSRLEVSEDLFSNFTKFESFFNKLFMEKIVGYHPKERGLKYPFPVYRARHRAMMEIPHSQEQDQADVADCVSRKK